jgi:hypothetical protein
MSPRRLVLQMLVLLAVVAAGNGAVAFMSRNSVPRQKLRSIQASPPADVLFLGNSMMEAGVDGGAFESAWPDRRPHALNLGLGSSTPAEHALLLRAAGRHAGAHVVYGFFDMQLTDPVPGGWADLTGNRAMSYYANLDSAVALYAPDSPLRAAQMRVVSRVPMLVERMAVWARVEQLRRRLGGFGLPAEETNRFGRAADFDQLAASDPAEFRAAVDRRAPLNGPVKDLFATARKRGSNVLVVEMPLRAEHRSKVYETEPWRLYRSYLESLVRKEGARYLVASDWISDDGFADQLHLNSAGAKEFSERLARAMCASQAEEAARRPGTGP